MKKLTAWILALVLVLGMVPMAGAAEPESAVLNAWADTSVDVEAKPMTRFWFPDAGAGLTDEDYVTYKEQLSTGSDALYSEDYLYSVADIIHELYDAGFGGVEMTMLCDSANYSSTQAQVIGWGTPAWARVMAQALYTANNLGDGEFKVDLTLTSHWPLIIDNIDPNDDQQQKGLVSADATALDLSTLDTDGKTRLSLPAQDTSDNGGATFLFEDELVSVTLIQKVDGKYDLATAVVLDAEEADGYAVGVPESSTLVKVDGTWYDSGWFAEQYPDVDLTDCQTQNVSKQDSFNIAYGKENGRNRDYLDDWQYQYDVSNADILAAIGEETDAEWYLVPVYSRGTGQNMSGNGTITMPYRTYTVNYYTPDGAYAVIEYWENNILDVESYVYNDAGELVGPVTVRQLMQESEVSAIFEDSLELNLGDTKVAWSADMLDFWQDYYGYDASAYLGVLLDSGAYTDSSDSAKVRNISTDFGNLKEELFNDKHCEVISEWATAGTTLESSVAVGYNEYLEKYGITAQSDNYGAHAGGGYRFQSGSDDFQKSIDVDIVEGDNSSYNGDAIRRMTGTVNIKDENGYTSFEALTLTMNDTVFYGAQYELNFCFSGGINRVVLHGTPYSQPFNNGGMMNMNQWPGWTFMNYGCYDARQAYFADLYNEDGTVNEGADVFNWTGYITRYQALLQNTEEQVDFLVVGNGTSTFSRDLLDQGYHYNVTSEYGIIYDSDVTDPDNIVNGVMNAGGHNIQALVLNNITSVDNPEFLDRLLAYADKGLTILNLNSNITSVSGTEGKSEHYTDAYVTDQWEKLLGYDNVITISAAEDVADYVDSAISYDVRYETTGSKETGSVEAKALVDDDADVTYYYIWNGATTAYEKKSGGGFPGGPGGGPAPASTDDDSNEEKTYLYGVEAFNSVYGQGGYAEMLDYEGVRQTVTVTIDCAENEYPYLMDATSGECYALNAYSRNGDGTITLDLDMGGFDAMVLAVTAETGLFEGAEVLYAREEGKTYDLTANGWTLDVTGFSKTEGKTSGWIEDDVTTYTQYTKQLDTLTLWDNIEGLESVSGYAYYTTTFTYDPTGADGAYLYYEHMADETARCQDMVTEVTVVNAEGEKTVFETVDQLFERVDLGDALSAGENTITVKLVTTLAAAKKANGNFMNVSDNQNYGLTALSVVSYANDTVPPFSTIVLDVDGQTESSMDAKTLTYTVSAKEMVNAATATITMEISGDVSAPKVELLNGWYEIAQSYQNGVLTLVIGNNEGVTGAGELFRISAAPTKVGSARVSLQEATISAYDGEAEDFVKASFGTSSVETTIDYSKFDVNLDGVVNQLDITRAQRAFGATAQSANWNARADVDGSGTVDIQDFILILNNYSK